MVFSLISTDAALRDRLDAQLTLAREARAAGDRNAALAAFQAAAEIDPQHAGIKSEIATDLRELGQPCVTMASTMPHSAKSLLAIGCGCSA